MRVYINNNNNNSNTKNQRSIDALINKRVKARFERLVRLCVFMVHKYVVCIIIKTTTATKITGEIKTPWRR